MRDHIATAEKSVVRVLLGGKALVTVRELSSLTIKEEIGRSTIDLTSGKIAMGVVRQRMRPGEVIEIRTPNAIAAIRGHGPGRRADPRAGRLARPAELHHQGPRAPRPRRGVRPQQSGRPAGAGRHPRELEPHRERALLAGAAVARRAPSRCSPASAPRPRSRKGPRSSSQASPRASRRRRSRSPSSWPPRRPARARAGTAAPAAPPSAQGDGTPGITDAPVVPAIVSLAPAGSPAPARAPGPTGSRASPQRPGRRPRAGASTR